MVLGIIFAIVFILLFRDIFETHGIFLGMLIAGPSVLFSFIAGIMIWRVRKPIHPNHRGENG